MATMTPNVRLQPQKPPKQKQPMSPVTRAILGLFGAFLTAAGLAGCILVRVQLAYIVWLVIGLLLLAKAMRRPKRSGKAAHPYQNPTADRRQPGKRYDTFVTPSRQPADARQRRLENMRHLYEAGLLTREEYDAEVRRV